MIRVKQMMRLMIISISLQIVFHTISFPQNSPLRSFQTGDIIFQTSNSSQSKAIQLATKSKFSHMGMIYEDKGKLFVFEAMQPVKLTDLNTWINRGAGAHYVVKRLKNTTPLSKSGLSTLTKLVDKYKGKSYDLFFEWSDDRIYCSELVWKVYNEAFNIKLGKLQTLQEFDLTSNAVKSKLKERYGNKIPLDEKVISPVAIYNSEKLTLVEEN